MRFSTILPLLAFALPVLSIPTQQAAEAAEKPTSYDGTRVVRINLDDTEAQASKLEALVAKLKLPTWTEVIKPSHQVDIEVDAKKWERFEKGTAEGGMQFVTMHEDLGESIRKESEGVPAGDVRTMDVSAAADMSWFNSYHSYADHIAYLSTLVSQFSGRAKIVTAGSSYGGRAITGIHIYGSSGGGTKPAVIFHGTVHAREWITTMTAEFMAYSLLSNYANSTEVKGYVDNYDFYIFPVVNPDGFVYSQTTTRLWRKNRQPASGNSCVGTDINRNWNSHWAVSGGASTNPCDETYKGPSAGSTPEYKGLSAFQNNIASKQGVKFFIDFHSYSQLWMSPYGYSCSAVAPDNTELVSVARGAVAALKAVYGTTFTAGPICTTIYPATGGSVDYSYEVTGAKYSYTTEGRDTGNYGFVLPANQIYPSGVEIWAGVKYVLKNIK